MVNACLQIWHNDGVIANKWEWQGAFDPQRPKKKKAFYIGKLTSIPFSSKNDKYCK